MKIWQGIQVSFHRIFDEDDQLKSVIIVVENDKETKHIELTAMEFHWLQVAMIE